MKASQAEAQHQLPDSHKLNFLSQNHLQPAAVCILWFRLEHISFNFWEISLVKMPPKHPNHDLPSVLSNHSLLNHLSLLPTNSHAHTPIHSLNAGKNWPEGPQSLKHILLFSNSSLVLVLMFLINHVLIFFLHLTTTKGWAAAAASNSSFASGKHPLPLQTQTLNSLEPIVHSSPAQHLSNLYAT